jgi:hypothetical protein
MLPSHHPTELPKLIDPDRIVENYRNFACDDYDECLDEAVSMRWTSWTCASCPLFAHGSKANAAASTSIRSVSSAISQ